MPCDDRFAHGSCVRSCDRLLLPSDHPNLISIDFVRLRVSEANKIMKHGRWFGAVWIGTPRIA